MNSTTMPRWAIFVMAAGVLGALVCLFVLLSNLPGQLQLQPQAEQKVQPAEVEKEKEPVWQLHAADSWGAWRINTQTGYVEFLHTGDQDFNKRSVVKFPAPE